VRSGAQTVGDCAVCYLSACEAVKFAGQVPGIFVRDVFYNAVNIVQVVKV
jgi:hypothetical protein